MKPSATHQPATETFNSSQLLAGLEVTRWLFSGIEIMYLEGQISETSSLDWNSDEDGIVLYFNLLGKSSFNSKSQSLPVAFSNNEHNLLYCKDAKAQLLFEKSDIRICIIRLSKTAFFEICSMEHHALHEFSKRISTGHATTLFSQHSGIDFLIQTCISSILHCKYENSLKKIFLFSKVVEIIVLQVESFKNNVDEKKSYIKTDYDKERIFYAKEYLLKNIESPPSLKQLARVSGINEFKLKKGFKELFHQTVYEYLSDARLEIGKNDLLENRKTVSQIAFELGYSSVQHFSNSFKRKFGISPSQVR
jgi:AraC family transcriptional activator of pyochelin receptor